MSEKYQQIDAPPTANPIALAVGRNLPIMIGSVAIQAWIDMGAEGISFVRDRLQQTYKTQQAMLGCNNLKDMRKIQADFLTESQVQYFVEAGKMVKLISKTATAGLAASSKTRHYDNVPL